MLIYCSVDIFSKKMWASKISQKSAEYIGAQFKKILESEGTAPVKLSTDRGKILIKYYLEI